MEIADFGSRRLKYLCMRKFISMVKLLGHLSSLRCLIIFSPISFFWKEDKSVSFFQIFTEFSLQSTEEKTRKFLRIEVE